MVGQVDEMRLAAPGEAEGEPAPVSGQVRLETRTVNLRVLDGGVASSVDTNIATWANIPLCHNQWTPRDIYGSPFELELTYTDRGGRVLTQAMLVTPYCAEPRYDAECRCICRGGYMLGEVCETPDGGVDAGPDDGGAGDAA